MQAPRQHIYTFAHRVLAQDAHGEPGLWKIITGDKAYGYLERRWADAGAGTEPMTGMLWVEPIRVAGLEISLLRMPDPQAPTEPYFVAFVRAGGPLRYFVLERSATGGAFWAEWRAGGMRIRGADVPEYPADLEARARIPYPYAAAFVDAIVAEAGSAPAAGGMSGRRKAVLIGIAIAVAIVAIVIVSSVNSGTPSEARRAPVASTPSVADAAMSAAPVDAAQSSALPFEALEATRRVPNKRAPDSKQASKAGIDPDVVRKVIKRHISQLQYCYDKALLANATLTGKITITFTIDADGKATEITTSGLDGIRECVTVVFEKMSFPNPSRQPQKVVYPITFKTQ